MNIKKIIYSLFFLSIIISHANSNESFTFNVAEIEIVEEGNKFLGKKGGTAVTENNVIIYAENFEYDKLKNILYADTDVKIEDKSKGIIIFADKITYLKNEEIVFTEKKSKLIKKNITIDALSFNFNRNLNRFVANKSVRVEDKLNNYFAKSDKITYLINYEKIITEGETTAVIKSKYNFFGSDITILRNKNELFSNKKSKITDDKFTQYEFTDFIYFFEKEFLKAKNIVVISDNRLPKGKTDITKFKDGFFDLKIKIIKQAIHR